MSELVPGLVRAFFDSVDASEVFCAAFQIYMEQVTDLFDGSKCEVREGAIQPKLSVCRGPEEALQAFQRAQPARTSGATAQNATSSRSHAVFLLRGAGGELLQLVDLAGSEDPRKHNSELRYAEGLAVNQSLLALGTCLQEASKGRLIPAVLRRSKLT